MITLVPFIVLLLTSIAILVIRFTRPRFSYHWLLAACGALLAWLVVLIAQMWIPAQRVIMTWQPDELFPISPTLLLDDFSWPFALALATLTLAAILTDVIHPLQVEQSRSNWSDVAGWLAISAVGLLVIMAGNLVTLLLSWSALDVLEISIRLPKARENEQVEKIVKDFSVRIFSLLLVLWAGMLMDVAGQPLSWEGITSQAAQFLLLAVFIRVGILPIRTSISGELSLSRTNRIFSKLVPAFTSLAVLPRIAPPEYSGVAGTFPVLSMVLLAWLGISALFCSLSWANASDEMEGLSFWIVGVAALSLASTLLGQPTASAVWGIALLLSGGILFVFSLRREWLLPLPLLGAVFFAAIPLTPTWQGVTLYTSHFNLITILLMIDHGLLLGGYLRHSLRPSGASSKAERWTWILLPFSLFLLLLIQLAIAWWSVTSPAGASLSSLPWSGWWPGFIVLTLAGLYLFWSYRGHSFPSHPLALLKYVLSFEWLNHFTRIIHKFLMAFFFRINLTLEGKAGILWAMLILTLLLSFASQVLAGIDF